MFVTIINDCQDGNAVARQCTRASRLFEIAPSFVGVRSYHELEAAGNLIDVLDAADGHRGVVLVNIAPRHGKQEEWENGTPFAYFWYKKTLVVSTIDGLTLSLAKKFGLIKDLKVLRLGEAVDELVSLQWTEKRIGERVKKTQFRSFDFSPRAARALFEDDELPADDYDVAKLPDAPAAAWWVDNFGNIKTTLLKDDLEIVDGKVKTVFGELPFVERLRDVADGEPAVTIGSSGLGDKRFLEIVMQGKPAAEHFGVESGSLVL